MSYFDPSAFPIPEGFPDLIRSFTKEVLRSQPDNIYQFAYEYFSALEKKRKEARTEAGVIRRVLEESFRAACAPDSTLLDPETFIKVVSSYDTPLTRTQRAYVIGKATLTEDGRIDYLAFLEPGVEALRFPPAPCEPHAELKKIRGLPKEQLTTRITDTVHDMFKSNEGRLQVQDLPLLLDRLDIGLSTVERNSIAIEAAAALPFPVCSESLPQLAEYVVQHIEYADRYGVDPKRTMTASEWEQLLKTILSAVAEGSGGSLSRWALRDALLDPELGLSSKQVIMLCANVAEGQDLDIDIGLVAKEASFAIAAWCNAADQSKLSVLMDSVPANAKYKDMTRAKVEEVLQQAFVRADREGEGNLALSLAKSVLASCPLGLEPMERAGLLSLLEARDVDVFGYESVVTSAMDLLYLLQRYVK